MSHNTRMLFVMLDIKIVKSRKSFLVVTMRDLHQKRDCYKILMKNHKLHLMIVVNKIESTKLLKDLWMI